MLEITSARVMGTPGASGWSQIYEFVPEDPEILKARGRLFAIFAKKEEASGGVDVLVSGREFTSRLHNEYFGNLQEKSFVALKNAVEKLGIEVAACAVVDGVAYSAAVGGAKVMILRQGSLVTILDSSNDVITASGYPMDGDKMLIATNDFVEKVPQGVVKKILEDDSFDIGIETLGAVILKFGEKKNSFIPIMPEVSTKITMPSFAFVKSFLSTASKFTSKFPQRNIYIQPQVEDEFVSQNKKLTFSVGLILLLVLAVSIGFGIRQKGINDLKNKYQGILLEAQNELDQAISLASASPDQARGLFLESEQKLSEIDALKVKDSKVENLRTKIENSKAAILGEYDTTPTLFLDLSLLSSGFKGDSLSFSNGNIFVLDKKGLKIVSVAAANKKSKVVAGPGVLDSAFDLTSYTDTAFVLGTDGIYELGTSKNKMVDKTWVGEALIKAFAGNLYVLDKSGNAIYRYAGSANTFGEQHNWLAAGTKVDFSDAKQWVIDGSAYVLFPNSKILKFNLGSPQNFKISGIIPEIGTIDAIYADADNQYLYFLDKAGKRVVVTDKKGSYKAQYQGDGIQNATNLIVSEADKKIILLAGDKLFSIELRHI